MRGFSVSRAQWLQIGCCAVFALAWFRSDPAPKTADSALNETAIAKLLPATEAMPVHAALAWSSIEVIVGRNDTMDQIFRRLKLSLSDLASLRAVPDVRKTLDRLYPGEALTLFHRDGRLMGLERQLSESERLKVELQDGTFATNIIETPLEVEVHTGHATIDSSLFEAARDAEVTDRTALAIADIFAWDIDFVLDVQKGDEFVVTYQRISKEGEFLRDGDILAVKFVNQGKEYRAVRFIDDEGQARYYTPEGRSLKKAFLRAPVEFSRISSRFNLSRRHPVLNRIRAHKGVDYAAPSGTPVRSAGDGRVRFRGVKGGYGNVVEIAHAGGVATRYGHLSRFGKGLKNGQSVSQGEVIGYVGKTGLATGPHLHYEYMVNGVHKDPQKVPLPKAEPIAPVLMARFEDETTPLLISLDSVGSQSYAALPSGGPTSGR